MFQKYTTTFEGYILYSASVTTFAVHLFLEYILHTIFRCTPTINILMLHTNEWLTDCSK